MKIKFLGTGAADWFGPDANGELRRRTSTSFDEHLLIDLTESVLEWISDPEAITDVLITHSHDDHFDPMAIAKIAPINLYVEEGWADTIHIPGVTVHAVRAGQSFQAAGFDVMPVHGNHATEGQGEHTVHYLLQKGGKTVYYATDGAWLMYPEAKLIRENPLDALIIDATIGNGHAGDTRVFEHNSLPMVRIMVETMVNTAMLKPNAPVYLTHLARTLHPSQAELEKTISAPYVVCYDGLIAHV